MVEEEWLKKMAERITTALEKLAEMAEIYTDPEKMLEWLKKYEKFQKEHPELGPRAPRLERVERRGTCAGLLNELLLVFCPECKVKDTCLVLKAIERLPKAKVAG